MQSPANRKHSEEVYTKAGKAFVYELTDWYQDTRLLSEAVFRLVRDDAHDGSNIAGDFFYNFVGRLGRPPEHQSN